MEKKYMKRFESYQRSLCALSEARERDMSDSFVLSGTFISGSPKEVLKQAFQADLIEDPTWLEMLSVRNALAHDYDEATIKERCRDIQGRYLDLFLAFESRVCSILDADA